MRYILSDIIKNHYNDPELKAVRDEKEQGLGVKMTMAILELNCVIVVLSNSQKPQGQHLHLHKYFPYTLVSEGEDNGKICWGLHKIEGATYDQMFQWIPNPK